MKRVAVLIVTITLSACANSQAGVKQQASVNRRVGDLGAASLMLQQGMTEEEATKAIGFPPNRAELRNCGEKAAWNCRILVYESSEKHALIIFEESVHGVWRVNKWVGL